MGENEKLDKELFQKFCDDKKFVYTPSVISPVGDYRIICIGDIHGDYNLAIECLKLGGIINNQNKWIADRTIVVQIGDILDGCRPYNKKCEDDDAFPNDYDGKAQDIKVMELFNRLALEAYKVNDGVSRVVSLIGNHEIMNVQGNFTYVAYNDLRAFENYKFYKPPKKKSMLGGDHNADKLKWKLARASAFKRGDGEYAKFMACSMVSAVIIGNYIFVHAGILKDFAEKLGIKQDNRDGLYKLTYIMRGWLLGFIKPDSPAMSEIMDVYTHSPFWIRIFGNIPINMNIHDNKNCEKLIPTLEILGVNGMVVGHTPQFFSRKDGKTKNQMINSTCDGKLWRTDVGSSYAFDKFDEEKSTSRGPQVLQIIIENGKETVNVLH